VKWLRVSSDGLNFRAFSTTLWFVSTLFILYIFIAWVFGQLGSVLLVGDMLASDERTTPILILLLFSWVLLDLALKYRQINREFAANRIFAEKIHTITPVNHPSTALRRESAPRALRRLVLIMQCKARGEESSLHEGLPAAAAVDASALAASYVPLQVYAWILPVLGFIGTAIGMAHAIGKFSEALRPAAGQIEVTIALSQGVIPGLSTAFETTILALATALVAFLCTNALRNRDQEMLNSLDELCITLLLSIRPPQGRGDQQIVSGLAKITDELRDLRHVSSAVEDVTNDLRVVSAALASASNDCISAAAATRAAADALAAASKELHEAACSEYQLTIKRIPRP
jgi:biopolymer transport protein ExbB/TolQ